MEAYRDQYATLFNNGRKVAVIAVSVDPDTTQAAWARESDFPVLFASDSGGVVGRRYGAYDEKNKLDDRSLFVIAPDGKIAYHVRPFRQMVADAYTELAAVVDKLSPPPAESDQ
jgi:peroxiredoxin